MKMAESMSDVGCYTEREERAPSFAGHGEITLRSDREGMHAIGRIRNR